MRIRKHPNLDLWCREDGAVCLPPCPNIHRFKHTWTYGCPDKDGYLRIGFQGKTYKVHRLIAEAFIPNPNGYPTVDHYPNRDKTANFVSNLRWADYKMQENNRQFCEDSKAKYGVRSCDDINAYQRALRANNPEYAERRRAETREWVAKQKALGKRRRTCPDGERRWLTDSEFSALYG